MKADPGPPSYGFEPEIEHSIALACCSDPRFWATIGHYLDPRRLRVEAAQRLVEAAHHIAKMTGGGPSRPLVVVQRLSNLLQAGSLTIETINACKDLLLETELTQTDELLVVVAPVVQRVAYRDALEKVNAGFGNRTVDPEDAAAALDLVSKVGRPAQSVGGQSLQQIISHPNFVPQTKDPMLTMDIGVPEVDDELHGVERSTLSMFIGGTGAGKSIALAHVAVESMLAGHDVAYVTLEMSVIQTVQRVVRNLTNMSQREINIDVGEMHRRMRMLEAAQLGRLMVEYAEPGETSPRDVRKIISDYSKRFPNFSPRVIVVDFMDKLRCNRKASLYEDMLAVADGLRSIAVELDGWIWSASQANRKATKDAWIDVDAVADSLNKTRSADLVIGLGRTDEDESEGRIRFSVPKRREGEGANKKIGPIPWDAERGRVCIVSRTYPW